MALAVALSWRTDTSWKAHPPLTFDPSLHSLLCPLRSLLYKTGTEESTDLNAPIELPLITKVVFKTTVIKVTTMMMKMTVGKMRREGTTKEEGPKIVKMIMTGAVMVTICITE